MLLALNSIININSYYCMLKLSEIYDVKKHKVFISYNFLINLIGFIVMKSIDAHFFFAVINISFDKYSLNFLFYIRLIKNSYNTYNKINNYFIFVLFLNHTDLKIP